MDLRRASITADILNVLTDGKIHKMREIAEIVEVSETTVRNHIRSLQRAELDEDEQKVLDTFIRIFAAHTEKEIL